MVCITPHPGPLLKACSPRREEEFSLLLQEKVRMRCYRIYQFKFIAMNIKLFIYPSLSMQNLSHAQSRSQACCIPTETCVDNH
jgi:hypothetical protein